MCQSVRIVTSVILLISVLWTTEQPCNLLGPSLTSYDTTACSKQLNHFYLYRIDPSFRNNKVYGNKNQHSY